MILIGNPTGVVLYGARWSIYGALLWGEWLRLGQPDSDSGIFGRITFWIAKIAQGCNFLKILNPNSNTAKQTCDVKSFYYRRTKWKIILDNKILDRTQNKLKKFK